MSLLAVDVGGTTIKAEIVDADFAVVERLNIPTPRGADVVDAVVDILRELSTHDAPVGVAIPGIVDTEHGVGTYSAALGWADVPVADMIREATGQTATVVHDVTAGGMAEFRLGAARDLRDSAVLVIGTGVAAALMVNGDQLTHIPVGEIGHVAVVADGELCRCGRRGCLETVGSGGAIRRRYEDLSGQSVSGAKDVLQRRSDDSVAAQVWGEATTALADGILVLAAVLGTRRVVISGGLANAGAALIDPVMAAVAERATVETIPEIVSARFGDRSVLVGTALAARDR